MAGTETAPGVDRRPLMAYLRVQRDREREMIAALRRSSDRINQELLALQARAGIGARVREDQLLFTQASIHREIANLWRTLGLTVLAGKEDAAAAAIETSFPKTFLRRVMPSADLDYLIRSAEAQARAGIQTVEARLAISKRPLADSVYHSQSNVDGRVDDIINSALSRGASAVELAKDVRAFVRPDVKGGMRYAALRLGRTELNNAFHAQQIQSGIKMPWTTGLRWNLSGSHPRPDECNEYADEVQVEGWEAGVWRPEDVPAKPHPNCLCFTTAETVSQEQFINDFVSGKYDSFVDEIIANGGITVR